MKDVSLWKIPIEGGEPIQISTRRTYRISISPDGTKFAHVARIGGNQKIAIKSFENDEILQEFDFPKGLFVGGDIVWAKDGTALIYAAEDSNSVGNLWRQSLKGGPPEKFTHYTSGETFYFDLSPDGSELALIRGGWNYSAVLLRPSK
jgi:Tol biopolymer transport system component